MAFYITIHHNQKDISLKVELIYQDERIEKYAVTASNKRLIIERTMPVFLHSALKRTSEWKLIEDTEHLYGSIKDEIITAIRKEVE